MPDPETEVAEPEASTEEAEEGQEAPKAEATPAPKDAPKEETPPDYKALYEAEKAEREKEKQRRASLEGSVVKQQERDAENRRTRQAVDLVLDYLSDPDANPEALKKKRAELATEGAKVLTETQFANRSELLRVPMQEKLDDLGADAAKEPRVAEAFRLWEQGRVERDFDALLNASHLMDVAYREHAAAVRKERDAAKAEAEKEKKKRKSEDLDLESGRPAGASQRSDFETASPRELFSRHLQEANR